MEGTEYFFKAERFAWPLGKEFLEHLSELRLIHSLATFFTFSHNFDCYMTVNSFIRQRNKKKWRIQSFLASFFVFYQICNKNGHRFRLFSLFKSRRKEYAFSTHRKCFIPVLEALESLWCYNVVTIWNIRYRYFVIRRFLIIFATET